MKRRPLWTVETMAAAMHAARAGRLPPSISGVSIDSRTVSPGDAFFAIKGDNRDGHDFAHAALEAGAGLAVIALDAQGRFTPD
ncbi:MAG: UDP-N-acetylmuramoylalanyl-D-glutamyl-2, 6-diaminopimelate--D-alanyl-D-alanine ligase, partial [Alphaproteobacteria bacterium]